MASLELGQSRTFLETICNEADGSYTKLGAWLEISKHVIEVPFHSRENLANMAKLKDRNVVSGLLREGQPTALLSSKHIENHDPLIKHSNGSGAGYALDNYRYVADDGKENIIYASNVPEGEPTTVHIHEMGKNGKGVVEHIFILRGSGTIGNSKRPMNEYEKVMPYTEHGIVGGPDGVDLLILTENVAGIPDDKIHVKKTFSPTPRREHIML